MIANKLKVKEKRNKSNWQKILNLNNYSLSLQLLRLSCLFDIFLMIYIDLNENRVRRLSFYLAMEEWVARHMDEPECFFMWQVEPSVIFGRNQDIYSEVNLDYCRQHGIQFYRRKSGGGCVYADMSNVMLAYITTADEAQTTFEHYMKMIVGVIKKMGIGASWTEHNDIMIGDRKVSGNAFYHLTTTLGGRTVGRSIVHGTFLYDTNMENMVASITPSDEKLIKHGVQSVRQRICLFKDFTTMTFPEVRAFFRNNLTDKAVTLTPEQINEIEELEKEYLKPEWIFGKNPNH